MMNGFILQENTSILISRNGKTLYSILHRSLDLTIRTEINNYVLSLGKSSVKAQVKLLKRLIILNKIFQNWH